LATLLAKNHNDASECVKVTYRILRVDLLGFSLDMDRKMTFWQFTVKQFDLWSLPVFHSSQLPVTLCPHCGSTWRRVYLFLSG